MTILSLGTNTDIENIQIAEERLSGLFSAVRVSRTVITPAVDMPEGTPDFANAIMIGELPMSYHELCHVLKLMEWEMGRRDGDKENAGKIIIDLDVLLHETQLFKPKDWHRPYNQTLFREMGI